MEELTLHMIQAEERGQQLEAENRELRQRIVRLESGRAAAEAQPGGGKAPEQGKAR